LWDVPNDPRGELRWCLSKLRRVLDDVDHARVITTGPELIALDLSDCLVDAIEIDRGVRSGIEQATHERLMELCGWFGGDLLDGIQINGNPEFAGWLSAERNRYREMHVAVLCELSKRDPPRSNDLFRHLDAWLKLAPFDLRAHEVMLDVLLKNGRLKDAEDHVATALRSYEEEGLDGLPLRQAWQAIRKASAASVQIHTMAPPATLAIAEPAIPSLPGSRKRASIAIMPFIDSTTQGPGDLSQVANGLTEDIITRLAKLRVVFVIARGTVYALGDRGVSPQEAGHMLNVEYVASGRVRREVDRISVVVELAETHDARIVWTDKFDGVIDETFSVQDAIVNRIVAAIAGEIESAECHRAILKPPNSLDAWETYHRGLWHMYRFNGSDNLHAEKFFGSAIQVDPTFARAYAGLSFTHFQNAFLDLTRDHDRQIELAFETACQSLAADDRDPAAHWAMGRALWLNGTVSESLVELERSIALSPNFALGYYTLGFVHCQSGNPQSAIAATDYSRQLSPFDPLQFAMLASRALAHVRLGELEEAAEWAIKATARPNAHTHILAIAALTLVLTHRRDDARKYIARIRERLPAYTVEDFIRAFRFTHETENLYRTSARQIGFSAKS
jgi:TolB-like protein/DNA-binding SARP family transcriptional activator